MRFLRKRPIFSVFILSLVFVTTVAASCDGSDQDKSRRDDTQARENNFSRAESILPIPTDLVNFPLRKALIEFTRRQDMVNHPWYIYIYTDLGEPIGYYVGKTYPQSACNFLSSSEKLTDVPGDGDSAPDFIITAPSLDGIYYGGGGSSAACESMFFFDLQTDAMYTFSATIWIASDKPQAEFKGTALGDTAISDVENPDVVTTPVPTTPVPEEEGDNKP